MMDTAHADPWNINVNNYYILYTFLRGRRTTEEDEL